jgi:Fic family protein
MRPIARARIRAFRTLPAYFTAGSPRSPLGGLRKFSKNSREDLGEGVLRRTCVDTAGRREKVHFEAPGPKAVGSEMKTFLTWYEDRTTVTERLIKAGLAHLYFVTIHPFEDGNGRIARAITEMSLARLEDSAQRSYSMSSQIREERKDYYGILESSKKVEWMLRSGSCGFSIVSPGRSTGLTN